MPFGLIFFPLDLKDEKRNFGLLKTLQQVCGQNLEDLELSPHHYFSPFLIKWAFTITSATYCIAQTIQVQDKLQEYLWPHF